LRKLEVVNMKRSALAGLVVATLAFAGASQAGGPVTSQNGKNPAISAFTSICAVPGYSHYGLCGGSTASSTDVAGKLNAIQPKPGRYNLEFSFTNLTPGVEYRLWATRDAVPFGGSWSEVGRSFADGSGSVSYKLTTDDPDGLGFDLNTVAGDITIVTSWWSGQKLVQNADGTLATAAG
jgi:hypothetical protein